MEPAQKRRKLIQQIAAAATSTSAAATTTTTSRNGAMAKQHLARNNMEAVIDLTAESITRDAASYGSAALMAAPDYSAELDGTGLLGDEQASLLTQLMTLDFESTIPVAADEIIEGALVYEEDKTASWRDRSAMLHRIPTKEKEYFASAWDNSFSMAVVRVRDFNRPSIFTYDETEPNGHVKFTRDMQCAMIVQSQASVYVTVGTSPASRVDRDVSDPVPIQKVILDHVELAYNTLHADPASDETKRMCCPIFVVLSDETTHFSCLTCLDGVNWVLVDSTGSRAPRQADMHRELAHRFLRNLFAARSEFIPTPRPPWAAYTLTSQVDAKRRPGYKRYIQMDNISCLVTSLSFIMYSLVTKCEFWPFVHADSEQMYHDSVIRMRFFCVLYYALQEEAKKKRNAGHAVTV